MRSKHIAAVLAIVACLSFASSAVAQIQVGACCFQGTNCIKTSDTSFCAIISGSFQGPGTSCGGGECGACCNTRDGFCVLTVSNRCISFSETFSEGLDCSEVTCNPTCGDGRVEPGEECDDGNTDDGDGCSATCEVEGDFCCIGAPSSCTALPEPMCGNGIVEVGEFCDDGNTDDGDGCSATCTVELPCAFDADCDGDVDLDDFALFLAAFTGPQ